MVLLSRKVDYALLILSYLHRRQEECCAREIAACLNLSRGFTANILKELCQKGLVASHRGVKGGYFLQETAKECSLAELMESLDESVRFAQCNERGCSLEPGCPIRGPIGEVHRRIQDVLRGITLAELFQTADAEDQGFIVSRLQLSANR